MKESKIPRAHITLPRPATSLLDAYYHPAEAIGPSTALYIWLLIENGRSEKTMVYGCKAILRLNRVFGEMRLEAACARGLDSNKYNYKLIKNILINRLDEQSDDPSQHEDVQVTTHGNLRGPSSFE